MVWGALELYVASVLGASGALDRAAVVWLVAIVVAVFVLSLVCYVLYYRLDALPSFVDGALPLVAVGVFSVILPLVLKL